ncbi:MAG: family 10 glycosylhydrolase [Candidatus Melainabacteria bacterium]|nr:family 10 glycosylhydrolase [Candidatus Melainabacteria bacterium]
MLFGYKCSLASVQASEKVGVLYSYKNEDSYKTNNIIGFEKVWELFLETFEKTYLDYQFLCNITKETKIEDVGVNVIYFPLANDIDEDEQTFLANFINSGGKLIISSGIGPVSDTLKLFLSENGIDLKQNLIAKSTLTLTYKINDSFVELPADDFYSEFSLSGSVRKVIARWRENNQLAIGSTKNIAYIGYSWGQDIDKNIDVNVLYLTIENFSIDLLTRLVKPITRDEYATILKDIVLLKEQASSVIQIAEQLGLPLPRYKLKKHYDDGLDLLHSFNSNYLFNNYKLAREYAEAAKSEFAITYSSGVPARDIEIRAIWLDRGTIVGSKNPLELRKLIKDLAAVGFNVIFFETVNAGFPIYPSKLLSQNPLIEGWDPLQVAIDAAHTAGVELHAWVWTFSVGNTRHNLLISKEVNYPGPIIEKYGRSWILSGVDGKLRVEMQPEFWVSPANKKACVFLQELFAEIVSNYDVDGLQFDYIRFPFQKKYTQVGYDFITKNSYRNEKNKLPKTEEIENKIWMEWKAMLVSDFVKDTSMKLRKVRPKLKISAAVFAFDHLTRMQLIQQDWETWLINNWIDAVYPFYYSFTKEEIKEKYERAKKNVNEKAIIVPAFNLRALSVGELAERITTAKNLGTLGIALFATEHLGPSKKDLLKRGPFREQTLFIPYNDPLQASQRLLDEFTTIVEKITFRQAQSVLADIETEKEVYFLSQGLRNDFRNYTSDKAPEIEKKLLDLQFKVKNWLGLEKYLNREQRAMYINSYLDQIKVLLNYMRTRNVN